MGSRSSLGYACARPATNNAQYTPETFGLVDSQQAVTWVERTNKGQP